MQKNVTTQIWGPPQQRQQGRPIPSGEHDPAARLERPGLPGCFLHRGREPLGHPAAHRRGGGQGPGLPKAGGRQPCRQGWQPFGAGPHRRQL